MKRSRQEELTEFFGEMVAEISKTLSACEIEDKVMWKLSRCLHGVWREAVKRLHEEETSIGQGPGDCHPAFIELLRLVHSEVKPCSR